MVEADESDRSLLKLAPDDRGGHQRRARPPHDLRLAARRRRDVPRVPRARRRAVVLGPAGLRALAGGRRSPFDADAGARPGGSRFDVRRRRRSSSPCRAPTTRRNAAAALTACRLAGADLAGRRAALADFAGAGRRFERARHARRRRARRRRLRPPPDRGARDDRGRAHARAAPRRRRLPAAPVLAHAAPGARVRRRARARRPRRRARRLPGARARRGLPGRHRPAGRRGGRRRRRRPPRRLAAATSTPPRRFLRAELRDGDLLLTLGAGDVDALGRGARRAERRGRRRARSKRTGAKRRLTLRASGRASTRRPAVAGALAAPRAVRRSLASCSRLGARGGWLWLRDSCLVARRATSQITGVTASDGDAGRARALEARGARDDHAARPRRTRCATRSRAVPLGRRPARSRPTSRTRCAIQVIERQPVAALATGRRSGPGHRRRASCCAASRADRDLPSSIRHGATPAGDRVTDRRALARARDRRRRARRAAAPHRASSTSGRRGVIVDLRDGPRLIFGAADDARAKWTAAARVLAEPLGRRARPISTSASRVAWPREGSRPVDAGAPPRPTQTLNLRLRIAPTLNP